MKKPKREVLSRRRREVISVATNNGHGALVSGALL